MKKLEELFNLPAEPVAESPIIEEPDLITIEAVENLDKIDQALPAITGLDVSDTELDELAKLATNSYQDLMTLGLNLEARLASEILSSASQFLGHAISAKQAKINKKIKMIELQLKKAKLDMDKGIEDTDPSTGLTYDRNELLAEILRQANEEKKS